MRFAVVLVATVLLAALPAVASRPGQPLGCSDWVFLEAGFTCTPWIPFPCEQDQTEQNPRCELAAAQRAVDLEGSLLRVRNAGYSMPDCPSGGSRVELVLDRGGTSEEVIGYIQSRCNNPPADGADSVSTAAETGLIFDPTTGRAYVTLLVSCTGASCSVSGGSIPTYYGRWVAAIDGFTTLFEVLQSYTPSPGMIGYRVPLAPEGLPAADYFDTHYGDLATVGDWSQAQPLQCGYPASPPSAGDYLTVADPLPDPAPGHGRYYVTAVTYQGQRRYGRKSMGGVLSGRDPGVLPACVSDR